VLADKIIIFGDNSTTQDIIENLNNKNEEFTHIKTINYEDETNLINLGIGKNVDKIFVFMGSLEPNIFLILSIRAISDEVQIFTKARSINEVEKLKLAGANTVADFNEIISHELFNIIHKPIASEVLYNTIFTGLGVQIFETIIYANSQYLHKNIKDINLETSILLGVVLKNNKFILSKESYIIKLGDTLILLYE